MGYCAASHLHNGKFVRKNAFHHWMRSCCVLVTNSLGLFHKGNPHCGINDKLLTVVTQYHFVKGEETLTIYHAGSVHCRFLPGILSSRSTDQPHQGDQGLCRSAHLIPSQGHGQESSLFACFYVEA